MSGEGRTCIIDYVEFLLQSAFLFLYIFQFFSRVHFNYKYINDLNHEKDSIIKGRKIGKGGDRGAGLAYSDVRIFIIM